MARKAGSVTIAEQRDEAGQLVSPTRLYETEDGRVVEEGDPDARVLLVGKGGHISPDLARRFGLPFVEGAPAPKSTGDQEPEGVPSTAPDQPGQQAPAPAPAGDTTVVDAGSVHIEKVTDQQPEGGQQPEGSGAKRSK